MKRIRLTQGKFALVDNEDFIWLDQWKWSAWKGNNIWYAVRHQPKIDNKRPLIMMHRQILDLKYGDKKQTDHRNHNGLDNQRCNLRICTTSQNAQNKKAHKDSSSKYKGIYWNKHAKKWHAQIMLNGKSYCVGLFDNEIRAAKAYDLKARKLFGEFAKINICI